VLFLLSNMSGRAFQAEGPASQNARPPYVDNLTRGTSRDREGEFQSLGGRTPAVDALLNLMCFKLK